MLDWLRFFTMILNTLYLEEEGRGEGDKYLGEREFTIYQRRH